MRLLDILNIFVTGRHYNVENAFETGIRYRLDRDGADALDNAQRAVVASGDSISPQPTMTRQTLIRQMPAVRDLFEALESPNVGGGHANVRGLNEYGVILLQEMMRRGLMIDIDHMSQKSTDTALDLAERHEYPVVSSHAWFRDLSFSSNVEFGDEDPGHYGTADVHKVANEVGKRADQVERIGRLGGIIAPILNQGDVMDFGNVMPEQATQSAADRARVPARPGLQLSVRRGKNGRARCRHRQRCERRGGYAGAALRHVCRLRRARRSSSLAAAPRADRRAAERRALCHAHPRLSLASLRRRRARMRTIAKSVKRGRPSRSMRPVSSPIGISIPKMMRRRSR